MVGAYTSQCETQFAEWLGQSNGLKRKLRCFFLAHP